MHVGLVSDVEQDRLGGRIEDAVQRDRQLDDAEVRAEVALTGTHGGIDQQVADLGRERGKFFSTEVTQIRGRTDPD